MKELNRNEVLQYLNSNIGTVVLYFYTPLCGTCKATTNMLEHVLTLLPHCQVVRCNVNLMPDIAQELKIKSVPYLAVLKNGMVVKDLYAFRSVEYLYTILKHQINSK